MAHKPCPQSQHQIKRLCEELEGIFDTLELDKENKTPDQAQHQLFTVTHETIEDLKKQVRELS